MKSIRNFPSLREVRRMYDLAEIVERYVHLRKSGKHLMGICPFHKERTPSFAVYSERFYCYGCGKYGDVFDFIMAMESLDSIIAAAQWLHGQRFECRRINQLHSLEPEPARQRPPEEWKFIKPYTLQHSFSELMHQPALREYARERGWDLDRLCAMNPWMEPIKAEKVLTFQKWILTRQMAQFAGIADRFDPSGVCIDLKYRLLDSQIDALWEAELSKPEQDRRWGKRDDVSRWWLVMRQGLQIPWEWDNNPDRWSSNMKNRALLVCEGPGDGKRLVTEIRKSKCQQKSFCWHVISTDSSSVWNPIAQLTKAVKDQQVSIFDGFTDVVSLFDNDEAGNRATGWLIDHIRRFDPRLRIWRPDLGAKKDVSEFFDKGGTLDTLCSLIVNGRVEN